MTDRFDKNDMPDLQAFPSAKAQNGAPIQGDAAPPVSRQKRRPLGLLIRGLFALVVIAVLGAGVIFAMLSRGSISHERLRGQVEAQFNELLGDEHSAKIGNVKIAFGANGLIALDAVDVKILRDGKINLGVASEIAIKVKALPLLRGEVVAKSIDVRDASLSLNPFLPIQTDNSYKPWPKAFDFANAFTSIGKAFIDLAKSIDSAGLDNIKLHNSNLIGFDQLGFRSSHARLLEMKIETNVNYQSGIFFDGVIETSESNWQLKGSWRKTGDAGHTLFMTVHGLKLSDFIVSPEGQEPTVTKLDNSIRIILTSPFHSDGTPKQSTLKVEVGGGQLDVKGEAISNLLGGVLNFRFLPEKNQIELERSPFQFETTHAVLIGGLRYPRTVDDNPNNRPVFQVIAHNLLAYGMIDGKDKMLAALNIDGWIDAENHSFNATSLLLKTDEGGIEGEGQIKLIEGEPHLSANLAITKMSVRAFKQFWPEIIAPNARKWIRDGVRGGSIQNATVKLDFPPGVLGNDEIYTPKNISAHIPISGSSVKTVGSLPPLTSTRGVVKFAGTKTEIKVNKAQLVLGKRGVIEVGKSTLFLGDYTKVKTTADLNLALKGKASAMAQLGTMRPLTFTKEMKLNPTDLSGRAKATVRATFALEDVEKRGLRTWGAKVKLSNVSSRRPLFGRKIGNANIDVEAKSGIVKITGTAKVDGVPAKLALVEKTGAKRSSSRKVTLTLSDKARKKMGADTGNILKGPIDIVLTSVAGGGEKIVANLKNARLNLPWIGWSKGKGIPARAEFVLKRKKGVSILEGFKLKGKGFSAAGRLEFNNSGLKKAALRNVRLNKTDDFDVTAARTKHGYAVNVKARSYDGRAIIQAFMKNDRPKTKGGSAVDVKGEISRLIGFGGQTLKAVSFNFSQQGRRVKKATVSGKAKGNAATKFTLRSVSGGVSTEIKTANAGSTLRFLNLYSKLRGGAIHAKLFRDKSNVTRGEVAANNFYLLGEPRLAKLLQKPVADRNFGNRDAVFAKLKQIKTDRAKIDRLRTRVIMGKGFLDLKKGRLVGGDASATFEGRVYDANNRMNIKGTFLPGRTLNKLVSKIPILGLAFGKGKVNGLLGITFKLSGAYGNPRISVNPLSIIAPGVFRQIFKF